MPETLEEFAEEVARRLLARAPIGQEGRGARDHAVRALYDVLDGRSPVGWGKRPEDVDLAGELRRLDIPARKPATDPLPDLCGVGVEFDEHQIEMIRRIEAAEER